MYRLFEKTSWQVSIWRKYRLSEGWSVLRYVVTRKHHSPAMASVSCFIKCTHSKYFVAYKTTHIYVAIYNNATA